MQLGFLSWMAAVFCSVLLGTLPLKMDGLVNCATDHAGKV